MGGRDRGCREDKRKYPGIKEELTFSTFHYLTDFLTDNFHNQDHDQLLWNYLPFLKVFCLVFSPFITDNRRREQEMREGAAKSTRSD